MGEEINQDTQIVPDAEVIQNVTDDSGANVLPVEGQEIPVNNEELVPESVTLQQKLNEALQQKAVIEARYQELDKIRSNNSTVPEQVQQPSLRDQIKLKAKNMSDMIIENPDGASDILTDTLMGLVDTIKNETITQSKYQSNIESTMNNIKQNNPHLAAFENNIQTKAVELLNSGKVRDLNEALNQSAEFYNSMFDGYAQSKGASTKPVFHDTSQIGKGNQGATGGKIKQPVANIPEKYVPVEEEIANRADRGLKRRI